MTSTLRPRPLPGPAPTPGDLTIIMPTINSVPEGWADYHRRKTLEAAQGTPIVVISRVPTDWGPTAVNLIQEVPDDLWRRTQNVYRQVLRGAQAARTKYVAVAEDDCLYPKDHFWTYRPPSGYFAFDHHRWCTLTWKRQEPFYYLMPTDATCLMIAERERVIWALDVPALYGDDVGASRRAMHRLVEPACEWFAKQPTLCYYHINGNDPLERTQHKLHWPVVAYEIPTWGRAAEAVEWWWR